MQNISFHDIKIGNNCNMTKHWLTSSWCLSVESMLNSLTSMAFYGYIGVLVEKELRHVEDAVLLILLQVGEVGQEALGAAKYSIFDSIVVDFANLTHEFLPSFQLRQQPCSCVKILSWLSNGLG